MAYAEPEHIPESALTHLNPDLDEKDRRTRVEAAIGMRIAGAAYSEIAEVLEYATVDAARTAVERGLAATATPQERERQRELASRRLERLLRGLWRKATDEDHPEHLSATRTALALVDRHIRLWGLDAPSEMVVYSPTAGEMEAWVASMVARVKGNLPEEVDIIDGEVVTDDAAS